MNWFFHVYLNGRDKDTGINTMDTPNLQEEKNSRVKFLQKTENMNPEVRTRFLSHELQMRVLYTNLTLKASRRRVYHALQR